MDARPVSFDTADPASATRRTGSSRWRGVAAAAALTPVAWIAALTLLALHLATAGRYGVFRDELYYLACADRLAWGYIDQPPLSIALLSGWRALFGESVLALRTLPALAGAALVLIAADLARALGGGRRAQALAAVGVAAPSVLVALTGFFSMNAFDLLFWAVAARVAVAIAARDWARGWIWFGLAVGLGAMNKLSAGIFAAAIAAALPFTPLRRHLATPWPWLGAALALLLFLPHVAWQAVHGWPTAEFVANATRYKIARLGLPEFALQVVLQAQPLAVLLWIPGLAWLLAGRGAGRFRLLGLAALAVLAFLALERSKPYYVAPLLPLLFAAGGVAVEGLARRPGRRWVVPAVAGAILVGGAAAAPLTVPLLAPGDLVRYQAALGLAPESGENQALGSLPQHFADRFGWEEMTAAVARVWDAIPADERASTAIVTANYGEAGAIRYYGPRYGLPRAASQHNNYFLWGPTVPLDRLTTVLAVGIPAADLRESFADVRPAGRVEHPYAMPYETGEILWVARHPTRPLAEAWREGKHFI